MSIVQVVKNGFASVFTSRDHATSETDRNIRLEGIADAVWGGYDDEYDDPQFYTQDSVANVTG